MSSVALLVALGTRVLLQLPSDQPGDRLGRSLAHVGDVDGDGRSELLVGAPRADGPGGPRAGRALLVTADGRVRLALHGDHAEDGLGHAVADPGDLDGDGWPDLLVSAPAGTPAAGQVRAYHGLTGALLWARDGAAPGERFGHALAALGDVDLDGTPDVLVGAPHAASAGTLSGRVAALSGVDGAVLWTRTGAPFDQLGLSVAGVGDVDDDGRPDALLGAPFSDEGGFNVGRATLCRGHDGAVLAGWSGLQPGDLLGHGVAAAGDLDGDGLGDLLLAAPGSDQGGLDAGRVTARRADGSLLHGWDGDAPGTWLVHAAGVGDTNGDGHDDVALGQTALGPQQSGRVSVRSGATGLLLQQLEPPVPWGWAGHALAGPGDLDGDGLDDLAVGAPGHDDEIDHVGRLWILGGR